MQPYAKYIINIFLNTVKEFLHCFTYKRPEYLNIDIKDYSFNKFELREDSSPIVFDIRKKKVGSFKVDDDNDEEEDLTEEEVLNEIDAEIN